MRVIRPESKNGNKSFVIAILEVLGRIFSEKEIVFFWYWVYLENNMILLEIWPKISPSGKLLSSRYLNSPTENLRRVTEASTERSKSPWSPITCLASSIPGCLHSGAPQMHSLHTCQPCRASASPAQQRSPVPLLGFPPGNLCFLNLVDYLFPFPC